MRLCACAFSVAIVIAAAGCGGAAKHAAPPPSDTTDNADSGAPDAATADEPIDAAVVATNDHADAAAPPPTHPPVAIRGKCVDPLADAKSRAKIPKASDLPQPPTRVDLDGDGVEDWVITAGADTEDSGYVYITRRNCGIFVLNWRGSEPIPIETWTRGFVDLQVASTCKSNCCAVETVLLYKWNGRVYTKAGTRTATRSCLGAGHP